MKKVYLKTKLLLLLLIAIISASVFYLLKFTKIFSKDKTITKEKVELTEDKQEIIVEKKTKAEVKSEDNKQDIKKEQTKVISVIQNEDIAQAVRQTVADIGGIRLAKPESIVLIKPNVNSNGKFPATTNPQVITTLIEMAYQAGAKKVIVADSSGVGWPNTIGLKLIF